MEGDHARQCVLCPTEVRAPIRGERGAGGGRFETDKEGVHTNDELPRHTLLNRLFKPMIHSIHSISTHSKIIHLSPVTSISMAIHTHYSVLIILKVRYRLGIQSLALDPVLALLRSSTVRNWVDNKV